MPTPTPVPTPLPTSTPLPASTTHLPARDDIRERRFTWSHSRKRLYDDCPRAYYYRYYGSRDGWLPEAPPLARALYVLKGLKGRPLWAGNVVHEAVEELLRETREGKIRHDDPDYVVESVLARRMRPQWKASREGRYMENPREHVGLLEHHYDHKVSRAEWALLAEDVKTAIRTFLESKYWSLAERLPEKDWLLLEDADPPDMPVPRTGRAERAIRWGPRASVTRTTSTRYRPRRPRGSTPSASPVYIYLGKDRRPFALSSLFPLGSRPNPAPTACRLCTSRISTWVLSSTAVARDERSHRHDSTARTILHHTHAFTGGTGPLLPSYVIVSPSGPRSMPGNQENTTQSFR